jgi:hypothetical protein
VLERRDVPFAAIDLDWLAWVNVGDGDGHGPIDNPLLLPNMMAVVANDRRAGILRFVLAGTLTTSDEVEALRRAIDMPLRVVRLTVPLSVIEARLGSDPTSGRADDLEVARRASAAGAAAAIGDVTVGNDRPIADVAAEVLAWLGWDA